MVKPMIIPQTPAMGVSLIEERGKTKRYRIQCDCGHGDHDIELNVEECIDYGTTIELSTKTFYPWWKNTTRFDRIKQSFVIWYKVLTQQEIEFFATVCLNDQQAVNLSEVLKLSVKKKQIKVKKSKLRPKEEAPSPPPPPPPRIYNDFFGNLVRVK